MRGSRGRWAQVARARANQWTARGEKRFLAVLSATCNIKLACRAVGMSVNSAYGHRNRWPDFKRTWDASVEEGYHALQMAMLANSVLSVNPDGPDDCEWEPDIPMEQVSPEHVLALLRMNAGKAFRHRAQADGVRGSGHSRREEMPSEEVTARILKSWPCWGCASMLEKPDAEGTNGDGGPLSKFPQYASGAIPCRYPPSPSTAR